MELPRKDPMLVVSLAFAVVAQVGHLVTAVPSLMAASALFLACAIAVATLSEPAARLLAATGPDARASALPTTTAVSFICAGGHLLSGSPLLLAAQVVTLVAVPVLVAAGRRERRTLHATASSRA